jgi:hypothetical protein
MYGYYFYFMDLMNPESRRNSWRSDQYPGFLYSLAMNFIPPVTLLERKWNGYLMDGFRGMVTTEERELLERTNISLGSVIPCDLCMVNAHVILRGSCVCAPPPPPPFDRYNWRISRVFWITRSPNVFVEVQNHKAW